MLQDLQMAEEKMASCKRTFANIIKYVKEDMTILQQLNNPADDAVFASMTEEDVPGETTNAANDSGFIEEQK